MTATSGFSSGQFRWRDLAARNAQIGFSHDSFGRIAAARGGLVVRLKFVEEQMQVLRLALAQKTRQSSLRMTDRRTG